MLTDYDAKDGAQVGPLLDHLAGLLTSFTGDSATIRRVLLPRRQARSRGSHHHAAMLQRAAKRYGRDGTNPARPALPAHRRACDRTAWKKVSGYNLRVRAETVMPRSKQVIGDGVRSHNDGRRATEAQVAVHDPNNMVEFGYPKSVRVA